MFCLNLYMYILRTVCGRRVRIEHARPYESRGRGGRPPPRDDRRSPR